VARGEDGIDRLRAREEITQSNEIDERHIQLRATSVSRELAQASASHLPGAYRKQFRRIYPRSLANEVLFANRYEKSTTYAGTTDAQMRLPASETLRSENLLGGSMHNIDRTNLESSYGEYTGEYTGEYPGEYNVGAYETDEYGYELEGDYESEAYGEYSQEGPFSEAEEMELAAELLSVSNEEELDHFLGKIWRAGRGLVNSAVGKQVFGRLKGFIKQNLPKIGGLAGNFLLPGVGGAIGSQAASRVGSMLGLELEGLSYEDQEFEIAKQLVRFGGAAMAHAADEEVSGAPPAQAAQAALTAAAQQYAPGMVSGAAQAQPGAPRGYTQAGAPRGYRCPHRKQGYWVRRPNGIMLVGA
jgi:hypothetical protein